ncbi:MAG: FkbM family methyltransferase [Bacteroidetes bacterium]|nr:FkbM family methyltransferase [Bacteroidota bacterium]
MTICLFGMNYIKKLIQLTMRSLGYKIVPLDYYDTDYLEKLETVNKKWLVHLGIKTIIDVGASDGGFAKKIRNWLPSAQLYCIEPIKASFQKLSEKFVNDPNFRSFNLALSDRKETRSFYVHSAAGCSSLLPMAELHKKVYPGSESYVEENLETSTLDEVFCNFTLTAPVLLKIDVQGAEKLVLEGASQLLGNVKVIFLEISFTELYDQNPLVNEMIAFLETRGFSLAGMENISQSLIDGTFLQADAFFVKREPVTESPFNPASHGTE